jgi:hypothetical protein
MRIRIRRFLLLLGYLQYMLSFEMPRLTRAAVNSSIELAAKGKKC